MTWLVPYWMSIKNMPKFTSKPPSFPVMDVLGEIFYGLMSLPRMRKKRLALSGDVTKKLLI
ncbi:hypothetical protein AAX08_07725 [Moraxella bovoculi]|nr:hypothetical protein AAX08_07725 [Moraxella bovoculi]